MVHETMRFESTRNLFGYRTDSQVLVWMKPQEFLDRAGKATSLHESNIKELSDKMEKDVPIDPLYMDIDTVNCKVTGHEGRHRADAAKKVGISKVPVLLYLKDDKHNFTTVKEYTKKGCKCDILNPEKEKHN